MGQEAGAGIAQGVGNLGGAYITGEANKNVASSQKEASKYAADLQYKQAQDQLNFAKQAYGEQSEAYKQAYQKAAEAANQAGSGLDTLYSDVGQDVSQGYGDLQNSLSGGYSSALQEAGKTPAEILQLKKDIESGNARTLSQGRNELAAALATQGIRGGQAATQLRRGIGEQTEAATENINQLLANTANQSKAYQQALLNSQLQAQEQLGAQGLAAKQSIGQQQLTGREAYKQALQAFLNNPESAKYAK